MMSFQTMFNKALAQEEVRLERIITAEQVGICYKDPGYNMQEYEEDPALREILIEYQRERIRKMQLTGPTLEHHIPTAIYLVQED